MVRYWYFGGPSLGRVGTGRLGACGVSSSGCTCAVCLAGHPSSCCVLLRTTSDVGMMMCGWITSSVDSASISMRTAALAIP